MAKEPLPFCECGECGLRVTKKGNRFILGHNRRGKSHTLKTKKKMVNSHTSIPLSPEHITAIRESDATKAKNEAQKGVPLSPEHCANLSKASIGVPKSPEHCAALSAAKLGVPRSPEARAAIVRGREESGANDAMRGGGDLVDHHYIYDHNDLSLNTVKMTRSDHQKLHRLLQKLGYIVPHINVKAE